MAKASVIRVYHSTSVLLPDATVLNAGGGVAAVGRSTAEAKARRAAGHELREEGPFQNSAQIYSPPYLFKGARPTITSAPASVAYGETFTVSTPDAADIVKVTWIRPGAVTHAFDESQRFMTLEKGSDQGRVDRYRARSRRDFAARSVHAFPHQWCRRPLGGEVRDDPQMKRRVLIAIAALLCAAIASATDIPDAAVVDQDGRALHFYRDLVKHKVVVVAFFFTRCQRRLSDDHLHALASPDGVRRPPRTRRFARIRLARSGTRHAGRLSRTGRPSTA